MPFDLTAFRWLLTAQGLSGAVGVSNSVRSGEAGMILVVMKMKTTMTMCGNDDAGVLVASAVFTAISDVGVVTVAIVVAVMSAVFADCCYVLVVGLCSG